jgi:hypothetical protein
VTLLKAASIYFTHSLTHARTTSMATLFFVFKPVFINFSECLSSFSSLHHIRLPTGYGMKGRGAIPAGIDVSVFGTVSREAVGVSLLPIQW